MIYGRKRVSRIRRGQRIVCQFSPIFVQTPQTRDLRGIGMIQARLLHGVGRDSVCLFRCFKLSETYINSGMRVKLL